MHHVLFGRGNQEEPSFEINDCSLTYCVFLRNSLILSIVIVGGTQGCQSMERAWLALTLHQSALFTGIRSTFSIAFSLGAQETRGATPPFKLVI